MSGNQDFMQEGKAGHFFAKAMGRMSKPKRVEKRKGGAGFEKHKGVKSRV